MRGAEVGVRDRRPEARERLDLREQGLSAGSTYPALLKK